MTSSASRSVPATVVLVAMVLLAALSPLARADTPEEKHQRWLGNSVDQAMREGLEWMVTVQRPDGQWLS